MSLTTDEKFPQFHVGQRVRCVKNSGTMLTEGAVYTITHVDKYDPSGRYNVRVMENPKRDQLLYASRFVPEESNIYERLAERIMELNNASPSLPTKAQLVELLKSIT